jgi:hypothetical protein
MTLAMILAANTLSMVNLAHLLKRYEDVIRAFGCLYSSALYLSGKAQAYFLLYKLISIRRHVRTRASTPQPVKPVRAITIAAYCASTLAASQAPSPRKGRESPPFPVVVSADLYVAMVGLILTGHR